MASPHTERAATADTVNGSPKLIGLGGAIKELDGRFEPNSQVSCGGVIWQVTRRWNALSLVKPQRRWEIPEDVLAQAALERLKPEWSQSRYCRAARTIDLTSGEQSDPGRVYTPQERDAFVARRADGIAEPAKSERKGDWLWWYHHGQRCAYWAIHDSFRGYVFDSSPAPKLHDKWAPTRQRRDRGEWAAMPSPRVRIPRIYTDSEWGEKDHLRDWKRRRETQRQSAIVVFVWRKPSCPVADWRVAA